MLILFTGSTPVEMYVNQLQKRTGLPSCPEPSQDETKTIHLAFGNKITFREALKCANVVNSVSFGILTLCQFQKHSCDDSGYTVQEN